MKIYLLLALLVGFTFAYGQPVLPDSSQNKTFFSFHVSPFLSSKIKFQTDGAELIRSKHLLSGEVGFGIQKNTKNEYICGFRFNMGLMPYNMHFNFESPENSIFQTGVYKDDYKRLDANFSEYAYIKSYMSIDLIVYKKFHIRRNYDYLLFGMGLNSAYFLIDQFQYEYSSHYYIDENNPYVQLFYADIHDTIINPIKLSLGIHVSYEHVLSNDRILSFGLFLNYSPFNNLKGFYAFSNLGFTSSGSFRQSMSYGGIRMAYYWPKKKWNLPQSKLLKSVNNT